MTTNALARYLHEQYLHEQDHDTAELVYGAYLSALREPHSDEAGRDRLSLPPGEGIQRVATATNFEDGLPIG